LSVRRRKRQKFRHKRYAAVPLRRRLASANFALSSCEGPMSAEKTKFSVSYARDAVFAPQGLWSHFEYRNLGVSDATGGRFGAQVIRAKEAREGGFQRHKHTLDFQMIYILKGWFRIESEGEVITVKAGDSVYQPSGVPHVTIACSDDLELIEITSPAEFPTIDVA
jgi:quercetin dioxygenase-like cupin family protein